MGPRRGLAGAAAVWLVVFLALAAPAADGHTTASGRSLAVGDGLFWKGAFVESGAVRDPSLCATAGPCFSYPLKLPRGGHRLRVAIDTPSRADSFQVDLLDPKGKVAGGVVNSNQFNEEAFVSRPVPGRWTVRVMPADVDRASFRLRAKLEAAPIPRRGRARALLPNLKTVPPYEPTFIAPANPLNGVYPPDTINPPADVLGVHPISCTADEALPADQGGYGARRCLRITSGPINVGRGPYDMRFTFTGDVMSGEGDIGADRGSIERGPMFQVVHYSDGKTVRRRAGSYALHLTHAHFHDDNVLTYDLFRAGRRQLQPVGGSTKEGFCPADQLFGDWRHFSQDPSGYFGEGDTPAGNCFSFTDGFLGLTAGWGDVYRWQRPGQFVEFAGQPDGLYVITSTVDKSGEVSESNEGDNVSYAYVRVAGEQISLLERGQGRSPWDRRKVVFRGAGPASRD